MVNMRKSQTTRAVPARKSLSRAQLQLNPAKVSRQLEGRAYILLKICCKYLTVRTGQTIAGGNVNTDGVCTKYTSQSPIRTIRCNYNRVVGEHKPKGPSRVLG